MAKATLTISRGAERRTVELDPRGMVVGRNPACDVVLDSGRVSRRHALVFRDPFGRWIVEDVGSRHGVWVRQERIEARAVLPGEWFRIGPFALSVSEERDRQIAADPSASASTTLVEDDAPAEIMPATEPSQALDRVQIRRLNEIADHVAGLTDPDALYRQVCEDLVGPMGGLAAVVRVAGPSEEFSGSAEVLACRFADGPKDVGADGRGNLRLSRRVLEAVRAEGRSVLASSVRRRDVELHLTVVDRHTPRVVLAAPITDAARTVDVLYLDVPADRSGEGTLDFVEAVARQARYARKGLLLAEEKARQHALDRQLQLAREIQSKLVPTDIASVAGVDICVCYRPAMWVGGDYCDTWLLADGRVALAIGDVCGKGLPAALLMANLQAALRTTTTFCFVAPQAMEHVNRLLSENLPEGMFVTLFLGFFDPASGALEYVNAGHMPPVTVAPHRGVLRLGQPENQPVGVHEGPFEGQVQTIVPGTGLVIITDGITEAAAPDGEMFGIARVRAVLESADLASAESMIRSVTTAAEAFREPLPQQDDVTVFGLLYRGSQAS
jgi:sigma-B regulation protein RsbU (phosphoserine phosphatase)